MFKMPLVALALSLALVGCGGSDSAGEEEASALTGEGQSGAQQQRSFLVSGQFVRPGCEASGTRSPTACGREGVAGPGSFRIELPQTLPTIDREIPEDKIRVKVSVKSPGILEGEAPIDVSFETDMTTSMWGTLYGADYRVTGRRFGGDAPQSLFPNNPSFEGRRGVGVSAEIMADGKIERISVGLRITHDLDRSTVLVFNAAP